MSTARSLPFGALANGSDQPEGELIKEKRSSVRRHRTHEACSEAISEEAEAVVAVVCRELVSHRPLVPRRIARERLYDAFDNVKGVREEPRGDSRHAASE
mmetsp:Transcript_18932/g.35710  ORF Transcript_18932/g.35710 Transcript_18932/m.35710 type:complete len:100 (-) Transcript_18932:601-900(-)